tara:strand:- start:335 stop:643 length:309 start_codon:yes stop_codon:yes gene_type:complete
MEKNGIMNRVNGIWENIKESINKKKEKLMSVKPVKRYVVMSKFKSSDRYMLDKQFVNRHSADHYAQLMTEAKDYDEIEYFLFEQSHAYEESPMEDLKDVVNG